MGDIIRLKNPAQHSPNRSTTQGRTSIRTLLEVNRALKGRQCRPEGHPIDSDGSQRDQPGHQYRSQKAHKAAMETKSVNYLPCEAKSRVQARNVEFTQQN